MSESSENIQELINLQKDFFKSRTEFYKTIVYCFIVSFCVGGSVWVLFSNDFNINTNFLNNTNKIYSSVIINVLFYFSSFLLVIILYYCKLTKEDLIVYSVSFNSFIVTNNLTSYWLTLDSPKLIVFRLVISFVIAFFHLFLTIFISSIFRNLTLKKMEYWADLIDSYNRGEKVDTKKEYKIKKKIEYYNFLSKKKEARQAIIDEALKERNEEEKAKLDEINNKIKEKDKIKTEKEKAKLEKKKNKIKF